MTIRQQLDRLETVATTIDPRDRITLDGYGTPGSYWDCLEDCSISDEYALAIREKQARDWIEGWCTARVYSGFRQDFYRDKCQQYSVTVYDQHHMQIAHAKGDSPAEALAVTVEKLVGTKEDKT